MDRLGEFYDAISPETSSMNERWFQGTADAIHQNLRFIESTDADFIAIFGGPHLQDGHLPDGRIPSEEQADLTIAVLEVPKEEASGSAS